MRVVWGRFRARSPPSRCRVSRVLVSGCNPSRAPRAACIAMRRPPSVAVLAPKTPTAWCTRFIGPHAAAAELARIDVAVGGDGQLQRRRDEADRGFHGGKLEAVVDLFPADEQSIAQGEHPNAFDVGVATRPPGGLEHLAWDRVGLSPGENDLLHVTARRESGGVDTSRGDAGPDGDIGREGYAIATEERGADIVLVVSLVHHRHTISVRHQVRGGPVGAPEVFDDGDRAAQQGHQPFVDRCVAVLIDTSHVSVVPGTTALGWTSRRNRRALRRRLGFLGLGGPWGEAGDREHETMQAVSWLRW